MATLEDLDRRVSALERASQTEQNIVRAVADVVAASERRVQEGMSDLRAEMAGLRTDMENRFSGIEERISAAQRETVGMFNDFQQTILAAIDKLANPPK